MASRNKSLPHRNVHATRSSISRLENEVKKLRANLSNLVAIQIYKPGDFRTIDARDLATLREVIDGKEATILQLRLML